MRINPTRRRNTHYSQIDPPSCLIYTRSPKVGNETTNPRVKRMNIYLIYGDSDKPLADRLTERLNAAGHTVVETLEEAAVTLGLLSPDAIASIEICSAWDDALNSKKPLLFVLAVPCSVPPRFARISFIDFSTNNEEAGWSR